MEADQWAQTYRLVSARSRRFGDNKDYLTKTGLCPRPNQAYAAKGGTGDASARAPHLPRNENYRPRVKAGAKIEQGSAPLLTIHAFKKLLTNGDHRLRRQAPVAGIRSRSVT